MTIETTKPASMSRAPFTSFQCTFALRRGSLNWARTLAWESAKHWMGIATKLTEILTSSPQNGCFTQKVHVFTCTFYRFESHCQAVRQSLWKKPMAFNALHACISAFSYRSSPKLERAAPTYRAPSKWPWENLRSSEIIIASLTIPCLVMSK